MSDLTTLRDLYRHMEWADAAVWRTATALPAAGSDERLRELLTHIHLVQRSFHSIWRGERPEFRDSASFASLAAIAQWGREYHDAVRENVEAIDSEALDGVVVLPWAEHIIAAIGRTPSPTTLRETMVQVAMHSAYHRAQANTRLRELGATPPLVDYIAWLWLGRPAPEWPA